MLACAQVGSRYNPRQSIVDNIHLPPSLISRFDLIYLVLDKADEASDRKLARHLLSLHYPDAQAQAQVRCLATHPCAARQPKRLYCASASIMCIMCA